MKLKTFAALLIAASIGLATMSQVHASDTKASGVITTNKLTKIYFVDGKLEADRVLGQNSSWKIDRIHIDDKTGAKYYRVSTKEYVKSEDVTLQHGTKDNGVVHVNANGATEFKYENNQYVQTSTKLSANSNWSYNRTDNYNGLTWYQVGNNIWLNSGQITISKFNNPAGWYPIHDSQIVQSQKPGYSLYNGVEGIKVYKIRQFFGLSNGHTIYDGTVINRVKNWQNKYGIKATGIVDYNTWTKMGFSSSDWFNIDSYVAPLRTNASSTRSDHIEAMIAQANSYLGKPWISGAASSPEYGVDCSGLVTQALYASGIDPQPTSNIQHAQPGNEWNCQLLYSSPYVHSVSYNQKKRGDLVFYRNPSDGSIWHVAIYLGNNQVIDSWPYSVAIRPISNWQRNDIAKIGRVFY